MNHKQIIAKCQENGWLKRFGYPFQDDPLMELDYNYDIHECQTLEELKDVFKQGNWAIRQCFIYKNLVFCNQVNGGDEWWTLKDFEGELIAFESISFIPIIRDGEFERYMERLLNASIEQCIDLEY